MTKSTREKIVKETNGEKDAKDIADILLQTDAVLVVLTLCSPKTKKSNDQKLSQGHNVSRPQNVQFRPQKMTFEIPVL